MAHPLLDSQTGDLRGRIDAPSKQQGLLTRLAWIPIPLLLAAIVGLWVADLRTVYESLILMVVLNVLFTWLASLCICFLTARAFLGSGQPGLLMFGCGSLLWGVTSLAAAAVVDRVNPTITIHNLGILGAALCHLAGLLWRGRLARPRRWLVVGYAGALLISALIVWAALAGLTPEFFVQGQGGKPVRQIVLVVSIGLFAWVASELINRYRRQSGAFYYWYGLGLGLVATGLTGVALLTVQGGILGWTNRLTQYLGSAYLFIAAIAALRQSGAWQISLEEALRASEERYRVLVEQTPDGIFVADSTGRYTDVNSAGAEMLGYTREEILRLTFPDVLVADEIPRLSSQVAELASGKLTRNEWRFRRKDGSEFCGEVVGRQLPGGGFQGVLRDITERKRAEETVRAHEERLRLALHAARMATWDWDILTDQVIWNDEHYRMLGYEPGGVRPSYQAWSDRMHADDRAKTEATLQCAMERGGDYSAEFRVTRPDGTEHWLEARGQFERDAAGRPVRSYGVMTDVTGRKQAEEALRQRDDQLQALIENLHSGVALVDEGGRFSIYNSAFLEMFGLASDVGNVNDQDWARWQVSNEDGTPLHVDEHPVRQAALTGKLVKDRLVRVKRPSGGDDIWMLVSAQPVLKSDGRVQLLICTYYDLSERKRAEEALRESRAKLKAAFASMTEAIFIADAEGRLIDFNEGFVRYHRFKNRDECSRTIADCPRYLEAHFQDGTPAPPEMWAMARALRGETASSVEYMLRHKETGETWWGSYNFSPIKDEEGRIVGAVVAGREITERKRAEEALRQSEERFRLLVEQTPDGIFVADPSGRYTDVNSAGSEMLGYTREEILRLSFADLLMEDEVPRLASQVAELASGKFTRNEWRFRRKDGSEFCGEVVGRQLPGGGFQGILRDITDRKRSEAQLVQNRRMLLDLVERCPFGIYIVDSQFRIATMNTGSQNGAFINVRPIIGRDFNEAMRTLWPEPVAAEILGHFRHTLDTGESYYSKDFVNPRGDIDAVEGYEWELHRMRLPDGQYGVICYYFDSSKLRQAEEALRQSEQRFRLALRNSPVSVAIQDRNLVYQWAFNQRTRRTDEIVGKTDADLFAPEDITEILKIKRRVLETGTEVHVGQWLTSNGQRVFLDLYYEPTRDAAGNITGVGLAAVNLTEQKLAEESLRQKEAELKDAQRVAHIGSWSWDAGTDVTTGSDELLRIYGFDPATQSIPDFKDQRERCYPVEDWDRVNAAVQETMRTSLSYELDVRAIRAGTPIWVTTRGEAVRDAAGQIVGLRGTVQDITARKDAEWDLVRTRSMLSEGERVVHLGSWQWSADTGETIWSEEQFRIYGLEPGPRSPSYQDLMTKHFHPEDAVTLDRVFREAIRTGSVFENDHRIVRPDGTVRFIHNRAHPHFDAQGRLLAYVGAALDMTERKQADDMLRAAKQLLDAHMERSPLGVIEWGPDMRLTRWSREAEHIFGWPAHEVLGKTMWDFPWVYEKDAAQVQNVTQDLQQGVQRFSANRNYRKDGSVVLCHWYNSTLVDEAGQMRSILSLVLDVTEQDRTQRALVEAKAAAESASKAKDQFIAVLSHELRTPLTPALAAVSMMEADMRLPGETREDLAMVRRNIALEVRLIADLLDVSRIISGKLHLEKRPMDVMAAIREAAKIVSGDLDAKGQTLTIETPGSVYLTFGDAARLQQVFWNLLRNANKFTPHRGRIAVRTSIVPVDHCPLVAQPCPVGMGDCPLPQASDGNHEPCGGNLVIEVSDNGSGMDADLLPRLFNVFEQGQEARTFGGLGLGLSICKAIVDMHGGTITAQSAGPGKGATFTVRLPVAQCPLVTGSDGSPVGADNTQATGGDGQPGSPQQSRAIRILLVEDHADTAKLMKRLLMVSGHEVTVADCVAAGLAAMETADGKLDLLISDLGLPDGSGHDLMRHLRGQGNAIPGIALSGFGTPADIENSKAAGFSEHLVKPINPDLIAASIQRVVSYSRLTINGGGKASRLIADAPP